MSNSLFDLLGSWTAERLLKYAEQAGVVNYSWDRAISMAQRSLDKLEAKLRAKTAYAHANMTFYEKWSRWDVNLVDESGAVVKHLSIRPSFSRVGNSVQAQWKTSK